MWVVDGSVCNRFKVRSSSRGNGTALETDVDPCVRSSESESESLSAIAICFPLETDEDGGSSAIGGRVLIILAMRCSRAVRDAAGREGYLGGTKAARFARRCTFASTPSSFAIVGDKTEADASGRLADRWVSEARGSRLGSKGSDNT